MKPSELRQFRREMTALVAANEELDQKQADDIAKLKARVKVLEDQLVVVASLCKACDSTKEPAAPQDAKKAKKSKG